MLSRINSAQRSPDPTTEQTTNKSNDSNGGDECSFTTLKAFCSTAQGCTTKSGYPGNDPQQPPEP